MKWAYRGLIIGGLLVSVVMMIGLFYSFYPLPKSPAPDPLVAGQFPMGVTDQCRTLPTFIQQTGLGSHVAIDSRQEGFTGLRLINAQGKTWQHPSWDDAGHVGAFERDQHGHIYVAPAPDVSLKDNPPELQNRLYRVNAQTGEMQLFMALPAEHLPSVSNPFAVMGMAFDCQTGSLYVSSIAGSSPTTIRGQILQINVADKTIRSTLNAVDAIGIGTFNDREQKRLYYGEARSSNIYSVPLTAQGQLMPQKRYEFSLATLKGGNTTSARKIRFQQKRADPNQPLYWMIIKEMEFGFRLPAENNPFKQRYIFAYQPTHQASDHTGDTLSSKPSSIWQFLGTKQE
ncbi:MAG: hypothetical protein ACWA5U_11470 [bacterium]